MICAFRCLRHRRRGDGRDRRRAAAHHGYAASTPCSARIQNDLFDLAADLCSPDKGKGPGGERLAVNAQPGEAARGRDRHAQRRACAVAHLRARRRLARGRLPASCAHDLPARRARHRRACAIPARASRRKCGATSTACRISCSSRAATSTTRARATCCGSRARTATCASIVRMVIPIYDTDPLDESHRASSPGR